MDQEDAENNDNSPPTSPKSTPDNDAVANKDDVPSTNNDTKTTSVSFGVNTGGAKKKKPPRTAPKPRASVNLPQPTSPRADDVTSHNGNTQQRHTADAKGSDGAGFMHIKDRSKLTMQKNQDVFLETTAYMAGLQELQDSGFLLITGPTRSGKTSLAYAFLRHFHSEGYTPIIITKYEELQSQVGGESKIAVLLEDVLEQAPQPRFSTFKPSGGDSTETWLRAFPTMRKAAISERRIIMATASEIALKRASQRPDMAPLLDGALNLDSPQFALTDEEKKEIVAKYMQKSKFQVPEEAVEQIITPDKSSVTGISSHVQFLSQCQDFAESTLPDNERLKIFTGYKGTTKRKEDVRTCSDGPQLSCDNVLPPQPSVAVEKTRKIVLNIAADMAKKCLTKPARQGKKGCGFQGLQDVSKLLSERNWTTEGVQNFFKKAKENDQEHSTDPTSSHNNCVDDTDPISKLDRACQEDDVDTVLRLVDSGAVDLSKPNAFGFTALHTASLAGHLDLVKRLLDRGCPVDAADALGWTALHVASLAGHNDVVEALIENGANVEAETAGGIRPLHITCRYGLGDTVKLLLQKGAEIEAKQSKGCMARPLHVAAFCGHLRVVEILLRNKAQDDAEDVWGWLPLHFACQEGHVDIVRLLIASRSKPPVDGDNERVSVNCPHGHTALIKDIILCKNCSHDTDGNTTVCQECYNANTLPLDNLLLHHVSPDKPAQGGVTGLYLAAQNGHDNVVQVLLKQGACAEMKWDGLTAPGDGFTALHVASYKGHIRVVNLLLKYMTDVDSCPRDVLVTPLHLASMQGHKGVVDALLQHGASPDLRNNKGRTPLHLACIHGHHHLMASLLAKVKDAYSEQNQGTELLKLACKYGSADSVKTLLHWIPNIIDNARESAAVQVASSEGKVEVLTILLEHNLSPNTQIYGSAPIHTAAEKGHAKVTETLLSYGATVNNVSSKSYTPLHLACMGKHAAVASVLLEQGSADIEARDRNGRTALHIAAAADHADVVQLLLAKRADVNAQDSDYKTPLYETQSTQVANVLLSNRADPSIKTSLGDTPLHKACHLGLTHIVQTLLAAKASPEATDHCGQTPLLKACQAPDNALVIASLLIETGVDVNVTDYQGLTPIHAACSRGDRELVELLLKHGADLSKQDDAGDTALHKVCIQGSEEVVTTLIEAGAAVNKRNNEGDTPLHHACANLHPDVVKVLLDMGATKNTQNTQNNAGMSPVDVVRSMALIPLTPVLSDAADADEKAVAEEQKMRKHTMERRKQVLGHFMDSNPASARSSQNVETYHSDRSSPSPSPHTSMDRDSWSEHQTTVHVQPPLPSKDYSKQSIDNSPKPPPRPAPPKIRNRPTPTHIDVAKSNATETNKHTDIPELPQKSRKPDIPDLPQRSKSRDENQKTKSPNESQNSLAPPQSASGWNETTSMNSETSGSVKLESVAEDEVFEAEDTTKRRIAKDRSQNTELPQRVLTEVQEKAKSESLDVSKACKESSQMKATEPLKATLDKDVLSTEPGPVPDDVTPPVNESSDQGSSSASSVASIFTSFVKTVSDARSYAKYAESVVATDSPNSSFQSCPSEIANPTEVAALLNSGYPLHAACLRGDGNALLHHLSTTDVNAASMPDGRTPLHYACAGGHCHIASVILRLGADVGTKDTHGRGPLHLASLAGHLHVADILLSQVQPSAKRELLAAPDNDKNTPLHLAAMHGHVTVASFLLTLGSDVTSANGERRTALHSGAGEGHEAVVAVLLANGAEVNAADEHGDTALALAVAGRHADVCLLLLAAGADPEMKNERGESASQLAATCRHPFLNMVFTRHAGSKHIAQ